MKTQAPEVLTRDREQTILELDYHFLKSLLRIYSGRRGVHWASLTGS
jgi:hypothetical protein